MLLGKDKLNTIEVLIFKALIDSYISHDEFVSINNVLKEYNEMKTEIKNPEIVSVVKKITRNKNSSIRKTKENRLMLLSNCAVCGKKKSTFINNQELHNFDNISNG